MKIPKIPTELMLGSSTAAHQVEGNLENNWSRWTRNSNGVANAGQAVDHYNRYQRDYSIASDINHDAHRFSIPWSRIMPTKGEINYEELEHYKDRIAELRKREIEPIVTLWHFSHPKWFSELGGWVSDNEQYQKFVSEVVEYIGDSVNYWVPLNEPQGFAWMAYGRNWWPPEYNSKIAYIKAEKNLIEAHRRAYDIIHSKTDESKVGVAKSNISFTGNNIIENQIAKFGRWICNRQFVSRIRDSLDFLGINYYFHKNPTLKGLKDPEKEHENNPPYPSKLSGVIEEAWNSHKLPIMITETGTADDQKRKWFLIETLRAVSKSIDKNIPILGYLYWTLLDCFEWHSGWDMNFGLIKVDRENQERNIREFAQTYAQIADHKNRR